MRHTTVWTSLAAASLATALAGAPASAQIRDGGPGASPGHRGPAAARNFSPAPRAAAIQQGGPRMMAPGPGARIEPRIRSGALDLRRGRYIAGSAGAAAPLTITRNQTYATQGRYRYADGHYHDRRYDRGWFPGLLAAPFLLPGYLFGGGYDYDYDYGYDPGYYTYGYGYGGYEPVYPGPASYGGELGNFCSTPQKVCQLYTPAEVGVGCSCRAPAGLPRFRGAVVP